MVVDFATPEGAKGERGIGVKEVNIDGSQARGGIPLALF